MLKHTLFIAGLTIGSLSLANQSAHALSWNWSYTNDSGGVGQGTFTTDGTTFNTTDVYTISGISGTYTPNGGLAEAITGLSASAGGYADQTIKWDGTATSPIIVNSNGFEFTTNTSYFSNLYTSSDMDFDAANRYSTNITGERTGNITTSALTPADSTPVPFEFSPEQGFILGIPLFLGLRKLKSKKAAQK